MRSFSDSKSAPTLMMRLRPRRDVTALDVEVKMEHRIFLPFPVYGVDEKTFEQVSFPFEETLEGGQKETFTEAARTAEKHIFLGRLQNHALCI